MKLIRLGPNAHALETSAGAVLFSYERAAAVRKGDMVYRAPGDFTRETRQHLGRFVGSPALPAAASAEMFMDLVGDVLEVAYGGY